MTLLIAILVAALCGVAFAVFVFRRLGRGSDHEAAAGRDRNEPPPIIDLTS